jgi:hypothetical protein
MEASILSRFFETASQVANCPHYDVCRRDCPSLDRSANSTPQPGFIGRRYGGLVIIGANPGIPNVSPFIEREPVYLSLIRDFARSGDFSKFLRYLDYAATYMSTWRNNLTNNEFRGLLSYDIETIAYVNIVKCRSEPTGSDLFKTVGESVTRRCFTSHLARQLKILEPKGFIGHWKPIPKTLRTLGYNVPLDMPCYSGQRNLPVSKRVRELVPFFQRLANRKGMA